MEQQLGSKFNNKNFKYLNDNRFFKWKSYITF